MKAGLFVPTLREQAAALRGNITRDLTGCSFPLQVMSFPLPCPQGRLWCRNKELLGFKAGISTASRRKGHAACRWIPLDELLQSLGRHSAHWTMS